MPEILPPPTPYAHTELTALCPETSLSSAWTLLPSVVGVPVWDPVPGVERRPQSWLSGPPETYLSAFCLRRTQQKSCPLVPSGGSICQYLSSGPFPSFCVLPFCCLSVPVHQSFFPSLLLSLFIPPSPCLAQSACLPPFCVSFYPSVSALLSVNFCVFLSPLSFPFCSSLLLLVLFFSLFL